GLLVRLLETIHHDLFHRLGAGGIGRPAAGYRLAYGDGDFIGSRQSAIAGIESGQVKNPVASRYAVRGMAASFGGHKVHRRSLDRLVVQGDDPFDLGKPALTTTG